MGLIVCSVVVRPTSSQLLRILQDTHGSQIKGETRLNEQGTVMNADASILDTRGHRVKV